MLYKQLILSNYLSNKYSGEFKLSPSVVKSVPKANVLRSGSVMRITLRRPNKPKRSAKDFSNYSGNNTQTILCLIVVAFVSADVTGGGTART